MTDQYSSEAMQVIYMEIEGIKIAVQLTKDAVKIAYQLWKFILCSLKDAPYKKKLGKTNIKNLKARANGQPLVPFTMDQKAYKLFGKIAAKYGILYHAFQPLDTGKESSMQLMFLEADLPMIQELMNQIKEKLIREDVKNGMEEDASRQNVEENNRMESMEEFVQNTGVVIPYEVFEQKMRERYGENYESEIVSSEQKAAAVDLEKVEKLADIVSMEAYQDKIKKESEIEIPFVYDEARQESDIIDQTDTHIKIAQKNILKEGERNSIWVPKDRITPPLREPVKEGEKRTAHVNRNDNLIIEFPGTNKLPEKKRGNELERERYPISLHYDRAAVGKKAFEKNYKKTEGGRKK